MTRQIITVEELDALPVGTVIREPDYHHPDGTFGYRGTVISREEEGWLFDNCCGRHHPSDEVELPATVLYEPGKEEPRPPPDREQIARTLAEAYGDDLPAKYASLFEDIDLKAADAVLALLEGEPT